MVPITSSCPTCNRRDILKASALAAIPFAVLAAIYAPHDQEPMTANGGTDPCPIP
jgi:hypothetical protein